MSSYVQLQNVQLQDVKLRTSRYRIFKLPNVQFTKRPDYQRPDHHLISKSHSVADPDQIILLEPDRHPKLLNHSLSVCLETASTYFFYTWRHMYISRYFCKKISLFSVMQN
jgi:hypothetical protein